MLGRTEAALAAYQAVLEKAPEREATLARATILAERLRRWDLAVEYARRALQVNPWRWEYHHELGMINAQLRDWPAAIVSCRKALQLHPASLVSRAQLLNSYIQMGDKANAQAEFEVYLRFNPPEKQEALRRWFQQRMP
jgi:Flp pilus assembly protein TadD